VDVDLLGRDALSIPMTGVMNVEREDIMLMIALEAEGVVVEEAGGQIPVIEAIQEAEVGAEDAMTVIVHVADPLLQRDPGLARLVPVLRLPEVFVWMVNMMAIKFLLFTWDLKMSGYVTFVKSIFYVVSSLYKFSFVTICCFAVT